MPNARESALIRWIGRKLLMRRMVWGFPLFSDPARKIAELFGVKRFGPLPSQRSTFVIGTDRRILGIVKSELNMQGHADKALEILRSQSE